MACMEHECRGCKKVWFDNEVRQQCPFCGCDSVSNWFDEDPGDFADDDREEDEW